MIYSIPKLTRKLFISAFIGSAILLSGCSSTPVTQDYSTKTPLVNYQTYQWLPANKSKLLGSSSHIKANQPFVAKRIEQAILNNLHKRGALIVRQQPQAYIDYGYSITRTEVLEPSTTVGLGWGSRHFGFRGMFPVDYETQVYEDVTWRVDIYNANQELVWRGQTVKPLQSFSNPQQAEVYTQQVIDAILNQYPPKSTNK